MSKKNKTGWKSLVNKLENFDKVFTCSNHIPNYKEHYEKLRSTLRTLTDTNFPPNVCILFSPWREREAEAKSR